MKRFSHIVAVLAFAVALIVGAAGGAMAHAGMDHHGAVDTHGSHHSSGHDGPHKAALTIVAPCCPAAEAPAGHVVAVAVTMTETAWHPRPAHIPGARAIAPEPPPPKAIL